MTLQTTIGSCERLRGGSGAPDLRGSDVACAGANEIGDELDDDRLLAVVEPRDAIVDEKIWRVGADEEERKVGSRKALPVRR
jgi:hypothetical protein